ncbi:uncharacterized protein E0L32_010835 [Thyridium curvatum]|uniref:Uncharacterized protein n=1 Tax=Thyridium curvatum TaxID=1093900 RepID=A0A507AQV8_9PEZI|nr:uncharacterized protein E0L32_010835 [Thyridium curvatum]TPX07241.1 hypothetical protein E0L32_010835 [Thyridium curvatum]
MPPLPANPYPTGDSQRDVVMKDDYPPVPPHANQPIQQQSFHQVENTPATAGQQAPQTMRAHEASQMQPPLSFHPNVSQEPVQALPNSQQSRTLPHQTPRITIANKGPENASQDPKRRQGNNLPPKDTSCQRVSLQVDGMVVEVFRPNVCTSRTPIILIHGEFHTGIVWSTKPDGKPGWLTYFLGKGYSVFVVDLPPNGRSNDLNETDLERHFSRMSRSMVEREFTACAKVNADGWQTAKLHDKWPGTGLQWDGEKCDPIFEQYYSQLVPLFLNREERQARAQRAVVALLDTIDRPCILLGEGARGTVAYLAADMAPDKVCGIIAIEPIGPPFAHAYTEEPDPEHPGLFTRKYKYPFQFRRDLRRYGLSDVQLTYDPPCYNEFAFKDEHLDVRLLRETTTDTMLRRPALDVACAAPLKDYGKCYLQNPNALAEGVDDEGEPRKLGFRQLIHLRKMPHLVVTAEASPHSVYDWVTVLFLEQAGVDVSWMELAKYGIRGNGHLCFLETNSDVIAANIDSWIQSYVASARRAKEHPREPAIAPPELRMKAPAQGHAAPPNQTVPSTTVPGPATQNQRTQPQASQQAGKQASTIVVTDSDSSQGPSAKPAPAAIKKSVAKPHQQALSAGIAQNILAQQPTIHGAIQASGVAPPEARTSSPMGPPGSAISTAEGRNQAYVNPQTAKGSMNEAAMRHTEARFTPQPMGPNQSIQQLPQSAPAQQPAGMPMDLDMDKIIPNVGQQAYAGAGAGFPAIAPGNEPSSSAAAGTAQPPAAVKQNNPGKSAAKALAPKASPQQPRKPAAAKSIVRKKPVSGAQSDGAAAAAAGTKKRGRPTKEVVAARAAAAREAALQKEAEANAASSSSSSSSVVGAVAAEARTPGQNELGAALSSPVSSAPPSGSAQMEHHGSSLATASYPDPLTKK